MLIFRGLIMAGIDHQRSIHGHVVRQVLTQLTIRLSHRSTKCVSVMQSIERWMSDIGTHAMFFARLTKA